LRAMARILCNSQEKKRMLKSKTTGPCGAPPHVACCVRVRGEWIERTAGQLGGAASDTRTASGLCAECPATRPGIVTGRAFRRYEGDARKEREGSGTACRRNERGLPGLRLHLCNSLQDNATDTFAGWLEQIFILSHFRNVPWSIPPEICPDRSLRIFHQLTDRFAVY